MDTNLDAESPMKYAIFFVLPQPDESERAENSTWRRVVKIVEGDKSLNEFVKRLGPGTYIIDVPDGLPFLGLVIYQSDQEGLHYKAGLLPDAPKMADFHRRLSEYPPERQN